MEKYKLIKQEDGKLHKLVVVLAPEGCPVEGEQLNYGIDTFDEGVRLARRYFAGYKTIYTNYDVNVKIINGNDKMWSF